MVERKLRAVEQGEKKPRVRMSIAEAAEAEDRLEELRSIRRRIARAMDNEDTPARDLAALSRRQIEIGKEIEVLVARAAEVAASDAVTDESFDAAAI